MAASKNDRVNLDALIQRQDLEVVSPDGNNTAGKDTPIPVSELAIGKLHYQLLRKPGFQRETDDWSIDNVVTLIKSFANGHLIPALIVWRGGTGYTFVIDGAHRLSALIAWVNDDFGAGEISKAYFKGQLPKKQREIHDECKARVEKEVGAYLTLSRVLMLPERPTPDQVRTASNLSGALVTQTVGGDAEMAATSFLAINQRAVQIDPTERYMIEHRDKPNVIAARALVKNARGHEYWRKFNIDVRHRIEQRARQIYSAIYEPEDAEAHSDVELQPAGLAYTANGLRIAVDLVNIVNGVKSPPEKNDMTGEATDRFIDKTNGVVKFIAGHDPSSMSLHPSVYFWNATGNHQPSMFLAVVAFVQDLIHRDELIAFTLVRASFEEFLLGKGEIRKHILGKYGGWGKSLGPTGRMLRTLFNGLSHGKSFDAIEALILKDQGGDDGSDIELVTKKDNWKETKKALRRQAALDLALRCPICKARMVIAHMSDDHTRRRSDGGSSNVDNAKLTHHFCNHGFKEHYSQRGLPLPDIVEPVLAPH